MRVLLDESVPRQLAVRLVGHNVSTVQREEWSGTKNGALLRRAAEVFDVFVTGDRKLEYQQNYSSLDLGIVVILAPDNRVETILALAEKILAAISEVQPGQVIRVSA